MKCLNCGREYFNGERFCSVCGQNLVNNTSQIPSDNSFNQNIANGNVNISLMGMSILSIIIQF